MHPFFLSCFSCFLTALLCLAATNAWAVVPAERLLPANTTGFLSIPDVERLTTDFEKTQIGQLLADPVMKPFAEDLKRQLKEKWEKQYEPLGITWEDLQTVPAGEVAMARILKAKGQAAVAVIADVTGKGEETSQFLQKVERQMTEKDAVKESIRQGDVEMTIYTRPNKQDQPQKTVIFVYEQHDQLVATDDLELARDIIGRFQTPGDNDLASVEAYQQITQRVAAAQGDVVAHAKWFVEPFGYVDAVRAASSPRQKKKKGRDLLNMLREQGFTAVQGVGGLVTLSEGAHDILHRTMVYAPAVQRADDDPNQDKYDLAMRMLNFPNGGSHEPPAWIPRNLATFVSLNVDIINGFEYSKSLVNALADDEIFEDVLESLEKDPNGPRVNIRKEVVANMGQHVMVLSNYHTPITTDSERLLFCIELTDVPPVRNALNKVMENDPNARKRMVGDHVVWEIVDEEVEVPEFELEFGFDEIAVPEDEATGEQKKLPNAAATVAHGHLLISSHLDFVVNVLQEAENRNTLAASVDYQIVQRALQDLGAESDSLRTFSRTDEEFRSTYELLRQGKMPESESMMGRLLNLVFDDGDDETVREQKLDGSKLPEFQVVRRYLGPAGHFVRSLEDGWLATGCFLSREQLQFVLKAD